MALTGFSRGVVWRSGLGILRAAGVAPSERTLTQALMRTNPLDGVAYQSYQAVARQLLGASRFAFAQMGLSDYRPRPSDVPYDPTIPDGAGRFQYTVAATVRGQNGASMRTVVRVQADRPLTWDEVQQRVRDEMDAEQSDRRSTRRAVARLRDREWIDMVLLAVGQRP